MPTLRVPTALRGIAHIVSGSLVGQGLVIAAYPILTRLYGPPEFGLLTVFTSLVGLISVASTAALESAVPIPRSDAEASAVAWTGLISVAVVSGLTGLLGPVVAGPLAISLGVPGLAERWWLVALTVLAIGAYLVLSEWMVRSRDYAALGRRNIMQGVGQVGVQLGLGAAGVRPLGLLLGLGAGRLAGLGGLVSRRGLLRQPRPSWSGLARAWWRFRRFPLLATPSNLINSAGLEVPLLLVSALFGDVRAGLLGLTVRVIGGPATIVGQAVNKVFTGESGAALRDQRGVLGQSVRTTVRRLLLLGVLPAVVLVVAGPQLFQLVFGTGWREAGVYARWLAPAYLAQFAIIPVSPTLFLVERQARELAWGTMRLVLVVAGPLACALSGAPIVAAVALLAAAQVISYVVMYVLCVREADAADARARLAPQGVSSD